MASARHEQGERRQEDREQEQDARDDRGEPGPAAFGDAGRAFDVGRVRADAGEAAGDRRDRVDEQHPADAGDEPSFSARPASAAMPVTVPIVSKKSLSMIAKIVSSAAISAELRLKTWNEILNAQAEGREVGVTDDQLVGGRSPRRRP